MSASLLHHIQRSEWQFFVTCTYRNSRTMSEKVRRSMQFQWLRRLAAMHGGEKSADAAFRDLTWILREEFGEVTNRLHWHALVSGMKSSLVRPTTCLFMMGYWEGIGGGMARIRVYDAGQDGASYVTKGLTEDAFTTNGANRYEVGKFNGDESLMLIPSNSLLDQWKRVAFESGRLRLAQARRISARCDQSDRMHASPVACADNDGDAVQGELSLAQQVANPKTSRPPLLGSGRKS